ncbi:2Fe-2S iron-sulfur cluster-binding protein [Stenotrophomonas rhizophila]|uniref:2Fe-2S iron-sulfur cluster-binding protein n=1 Tax=Stenotrophomonas rhizophila TaxID=216778 RepID=UPI001E5370F9|nr:2Fe-2S iron-sulfur cluster-binding protein [Stenotrophomonas rhizophila]MCC7635383.1 2Fe-2S iron-sulfur cluster binding domain-containing protein [Stenotrophomonas rhizophila]MCC7664388.1 2Fe-2S iron-sulfur cluster binding domain-containing protein [Stenotrophomonas rhizophila]
MTRHVDIQPAGHRLAVAEGSTILEAALAAGVAYPHGCRSGRCGSCLSRLISGEVVHLEHSRFALTDAQKAQGLFLACRAMPGSDRVAIRAGDIDTGPAPALQRLAYRVQAIEILTHDIKRIRLAASGTERLVFEAGQYARLTFPGVAPRDYSMAGGAGDAELDFHIRRVPGGAVSEWIHAALQPGDPVLVEGPLGASQLRRQHAGPILCIAGGSGLAPIQAIVQAALAEGMRQAILVYFGARSRADLYQVAHFQQLARRHPNLRFTPVLSNDTGPSPWRTGWVTDAVAADHPLLEGWKAYVAGPPLMVEAAMRVCGAGRLRPEDLHADVFFTPEAALTAG